MDADMGPADTEKPGQRSEEHTGECWGAGNGGPCSRFYQTQVTESRPSWTGPHRGGPVQQVGRRAGRHLRGYSDAVKPLELGQGCSSA